MPNQPQSSIESNFSGGLKTEFTGLNFPENACTSAFNCIFSIIGDVNRREGVDFEASYQLNTLASPALAAQSTYKWNNVGGDGSTQIIVQQVGSTLYFYLASSATTSSPLSTQKLSSTVNIASFLATNALTVFDPTQECTYADGNGYLFVYNGQCDPFYCTYNPSGHTITATVINLQIRDFAGVVDGLALNTRPVTLSPEHNYNLINQGWSGGWSATSNSTNTIANSGTSTFQLNAPFANLPIVVGQLLVADGNANGATGSQKGTVFSWDPVGGVLVLTNGATGNVTVGGGFLKWTITAYPSYINQWYAALKSYPANSDVWWYYRNTQTVNLKPDGTTGGNPDGAFQPYLALTGYITPTNSQAPQGSIILNAFIQKRTLASSVLGITDVTTTVRPTNGTFWQGRVWYTGVNSSFQPTGDASYYTWTETIYFSEIVQDPSSFAQCYQTNDPTSSTLFNLLPSDGGTIYIQGSGAIYKLFPVNNGLLVFAANGIWYISGSSQLGFTATDYSINKISGIQSIGYTAYVNVLGWPVFWNAEGIYEVKPGKDNVPYGHGGLVVENLALGTILSYYDNIPLQSKKYARGDYDPTTYIIQWLFRSTNESNITSRYQFDSALNINTYKGPFYPYSFTISSSLPYISGINYVAGPGGSTSPSPTFKYLTTYNGQFTFSEERDSTNWQDWNSVALTNYISTFTTGYKLHGQAWKLWWLGYIWMYSNNSANTSYGIRGLWNYGTSGNSGKWSTQQIIHNNIPNFGNVARKIRIRGHGLALQLQVNSVTGYPFNFAGWSMYENINVGI